MLRQSNTMGDCESMYRDWSQSFRSVIAPDKVMSPVVKPRILLVDDDPAFGLVMQLAAIAKEVQLTYCRNLVEFGEIGNWDFDVILMDYDLGAVTGFELTEYIEEFTSVNVPVILVSQTPRNRSEKWPSTIREFIHKKVGPFAIWDATFEAHEVSRIHKGIELNHTF